MALVVVLMTILPTAARASNPAVDQYVESVPTADGDTTGGGGAGGAHPGGGSGGGSLPSSVRERIRSEGGSDAAQLESVASSPALGAPRTRAATGSDDGSKEHSGDGKGDTGGAGDSHRPSVLDAVTTAAVDQGGSSMGVLFGGLIMLTAIAAGIGLNRRRA